MSDSSHEAFKELLQKVGARTRLEGEKPVLCFEPPLKQQEEDPKRWKLAEELEGLFWALCEAYSC